jgi:hypothetical protein
MILKVLQSDDEQLQYQVNNYEEIFHGFVEIIIESSLFTK